MRNKTLPWIPIFGGIYCQHYAVKYFSNYKIQTINFIYHISLILVLTYLIK